MPALGNKGKVFCSFVEYHWDPGRAFGRVDVKSAALSSSYSKENKGLEAILALTELGLAGGNRLAFSTRRQGKCRPLTARDNQSDRRRRIN
jgi:hypothetical protein